MQDNAFMQAASELLSCKCQGYTDPELARTLCDYNDISTITSTTCHYSQIFTYVYTTTLMLILMPMPWVCRVVVLDGGLPAWVSEGYKLDETPVSDDDTNASLKAAQQPPSDTRYKAHLQVCCMTCYAEQPPCI